MNKELKALEKIKCIVNYDGGINQKALGNFHSKEFNIIESALKNQKRKLDLIGEILVDVSKGNYADLNEAINEIREVLEEDIENAFKRLKYIDNNSLNDEDIHIVQGMTFEDKVECIKKLKTLETIKEKRIVFEFFDKTSTYEEYNKAIRNNWDYKEENYKKYLLTEDEYITVKEALS